MLVHVRATRRGGGEDRGMRLPMFVSAVTLLAACASSPEPAGEEQPIGVAMVVRLLPDEYVEVDGRRCSFEAFVYELRVACRAAAGDRSRAPWLRVLTPRDERLGDAELANRVRVAAYEAGVQHIEFELGGG